MPDPFSESTWQRAWRDTKHAWSGWWFWAAQLVVVAAFSVYAVTFYDNDATLARQAAIQAAALILGAGLCAFAVLVGFFVAFSSRTQRDEARTEIDRLGADIEAREAAKVTREQLLACRRRIGEIIAEGGDLMACVRDASWIDQVHEKVFTAVFDLCRDPAQPYLDESHVGRYYAAQSLARDDAEKAIMTGDADREAFVLKAVIKILNGFIIEVNDELKLLPR